MTIACEKEGTCLTIKNTCFITQNSSWINQGHIPYVISLIISLDVFPSGAFLGEWFVFCHDVIFIQKYSLILAMWSFLHRVLLFWYHVFTCSELSWISFASLSLCFTLKYFWVLNDSSNKRLCTSENFFLQPADLFAEHILFAPSLAFALPCFLFRIRSWHLSEKTMFLTCF